MSKTDDMISRKAAIDAFLTELTKRERKNLLHTWSTVEVKYFVADMLEKMSSAQPVARDINVLSNDLISRQTAIDALGERPIVWSNDDEYVLGERNQYDIDRLAIETVPSAQPTLYGYNIEHLDLIARVLEKENLPPERVAEALMDIGRIVEIVRDEVAEALRKAVEQCTMT